MERIFIGPRKIVTACNLYRHDYPYLPFDIEKGSVFYLVKDKFGIVTPEGVPASLEPEVHDAFYFELPSEYVYNFIGFVHSLN